MSSQPSSFPPILVHEPTAPHTHTLILIHPRSSSGRAFYDRIFSPFTNSTTFRPSNFPNWRIVLPSSKQLYNTETDGPRNSWFDQISLLDSYERWELIKPGLTDSVSYIKGIIKDEVDRLGGKSGKVVVMAMSMGAATALWSLLGYYGDGNAVLGGFAGNGGWLPFVDEVGRVLPSTTSTSTSTSSTQEAEGRIDFVKSLIKDPTACSAALKKTPVFWGHSTDDQWVDFKIGEKAVNMLKGAGVHVEFETYQGAEDEGHWFKEPEELDHIAEFLKRIEKGEALK